MNILHNNTVYALARLPVRGGAWWRAYDHRYGLHWRVGNVLAAALVLASVLVPVIENVYQSRAYALAPSTQKLVGTVDASLSKQLTYDPKQDQYQFNKDAVKNSDVPAELLKSTVGTPKDKNSATYALDVPTDLKKGVTYHDTNSQTSFSLVPNFRTLTGRQVSGHLVYPLSGGLQAIYTLKNNGLKEDIVVPHATTDTLSFSYTLNLPKTLEAKVVPDSGGAIGIYSADPTLFGDISYGSDSDRVAVEKAREKAEKTHLVFGIPAPKLDTADGSALGTASARFELAGNKLLVIAENVAQLKTAFTIDPSVVVASTSDFQTNGNDEGMISFGTGISGAPAGSIGSWASTTSFTGVRDIDSQTVVYNGYIYVMGGWDNTGTGTNLGDVQYAQINANGTIGAWTATTSLPGVGGNDGHGAAAYNGYMYIVGGYTGSAYSNNVYYAQINAGGSLGAWTATAAVTGIRAYAAVAINNGYIYTVGGYDGVNYLTDAQFSKINAGGALAGWVSTSSPYSQYTGEYMGVTISNGYLYLVGARTSTGQSNVVQYSLINVSTGALGAWMQTSQLPNVQDGVTATIYNGYIYAYGGYDSSWYRSTSWYAPVNADGSIGAWQVTTSFQTAREFGSGTAYNGYIYILGGRDDKGNDFNDVQYAPLVPTSTARPGNQVQRADVSGGSTLDWGSTSRPATARVYNRSVVYNGFIYSMGGYDNNTTVFSDVQFAPINIDGKLGTWASTTNFNTPRQDFGAFTYNGYLYVMGGYSNAARNADLNSVEYAKLGSDGRVVGSWQTTTSFTTIRGQFGATVYNGYAYISGGWNDPTSTYLSDVQYAVLNGDGSVGTWQSTTSLPAGRASHSFEAYNGYIYFLGGNTGTRSSDVYFAPINAGGTIGAWTATTSFTDPRTFQGSVISNGNIYIIGGTNATPAVLVNVQYAPINANGTVGTWQNTSNMNFPRSAMGVATYNGFLYVTNGTGYDNVTQTGTTFPTTQTMYAKIDSGGMIASFANTTAIPTALAMPCTVAYNGTIYSIGGNTSDGANNNVASVYKTTISSNGTLGAWTTTGATSLPEARGYHGCTVANGYIYVAGGYTGTTTGTADGGVRYIKINSDGTLAASWSSGTTLPHTTVGRTLVSASIGSGATYLYSIGGLNSVSSVDATGVYYASLNGSTGAVGAWTATSSLIYNFQGSSVAVLGNHLYAMGGESPSSPGSNYQAEYTTISSTGTLAAWQAAPALTSAVAYGDGTTVGGCIYVIGGQSAGIGVPTVPNQYACPNVDGTISAWYVAPKLANSETDTAATSYGNFIYTVGGNNMTANVANVQYGQVNNSGDGTAGGSWSTANPFTAIRAGNSSLAYNGYIYVIGGRNGTIYYNDVQYAPLNSNGTLGAWASTSSMNTARSIFSAVASNGYMYVFAGYNGTYLSSVEVAKINSNGTLGPWAFTSSVASGRYATAAVAYNGYVYLLGGSDGTVANSNVLYAKITTTDGTLPAWTATTSFANNRSGPAAIAYNGYLYVLGGNPGSSYLNDVQYAPINSTGTVGAWNSTSGFNVGRYCFSALINNGKIYILGGFGGSYLNDVQVASINRDGTLGSWATTTSFTTARYCLGVATYNGTLYVLGGDDGTTSHNDVQYTPVKNIALIGNYSKLIDLGSPMNLTSITYNGMLPAGQNAITYRTAGINGVFGATGNSASMVSSSVCSGAVQGVRYLQVLITLDDSGAQPGGPVVGTSSPANVTNFTVNYVRGHPAPNIRLHLGKTLQQGNGQSPLDTCYP